MKMAALPDTDAIRELSVGALIEMRARTTPDAPCLIDAQGLSRITYRNLEGRARAVASNIAQAGVRPGETVAYAMGNSIESACIILGIMYGGYLATAVNLVAGIDTIGYVLQHSGAKLVVIQPQTRELIETSLAGRKDRPRLIEAEEMLAGPENGNVLMMPNSDEDGLLMYTSGTTGRPKGVVLRHSSLVAGGTNVTLAHKLTAKDCALCVLPLYHINGLCVTVLGPLVSGGAVVVPPKFSVSSFWTIIRDRACTWFSVVPTQISYLLHDSETKQAWKPIPSLRFGRSASAPLAPEVQTAFEARFQVPIIETMGLTETAAQILSNPLPPGDRKVGSPGVAIGNEVIIADADQNEISRGSEGEVLVRGPNVMRCYLENQEATRAALTPDGWLRTGDLGRMDESGYVYITGRLKELIIKGGENIAPREIDEALYAHPDVVEAAAFARPCKDYGQRVEAGVTLDVNSSASERDLIEFCRTRIGTFKAPDRIHFIDELPKGPSGKIQRRKLQDMFAD